MARFIVTTEEMVEGRYLVDAADEDQAREKLDGPPIDWNGVEQLDYAAYIVEVEKVVSLPSPEDDNPTGGVREPRIPIGPRPQTALEKAFPPDMDFNAS